MLPLFYMVIIYPYGVYCKQKIKPLHFHFLRHKKGAVAPVDFLPALATAPFTLLFFFFRIC